MPVSSLTLLQPMLLLNKGSILSVQLTVLNTNTCYHKSRYYVLDIVGNVVGNRNVGLSVLNIVRGFESTYQQGGYINTHKFLKYN